MGHTVSIQNYKMRRILCIFNKFLKCQYILYFLIKPCDLLLLKGYISRHTIAVQLIVIPQDLVQAGGWVMIANRDITSIFNAIFGDDEAVVTWKNLNIFHSSPYPISNYDLKWGNSGLLLKKKWWDFMSRFLHESPETVAEFCLCLEETKCLHSCRDISVARIGRKVINHQ